MKLKKTICAQLGNWSTLDFTLVLLAVLTIIPIACVLNNSVLIILSGVLIVPCSILAYKKTALGYSSLLAALIIYCFALPSLNMSGSLILVASIIIPTLIYKIVKLYVKKLNEFTKIDIVETAVLCLILGLSAYPIYLLLNITNSGFAIIEMLGIIVGLCLVFVEIRGSKYVELIYTILTALQLVIYIFYIVDVHLSVIPLVIGLLLTLFFQIFNIIKNFANAKQGKEEFSQLEEQL